MQVITNSSQDPKIFHHNIFASSQTINSILNHPKLDVVAIICLLISLFYLKYMLKGIFSLIFKSYSVHGHTIYVKEKNGTISKTTIIGKCPIPSCSGIVRVKKPFVNKEDVKIAGICNKANHFFNIDFDNLQGDKIDLNRKEEIRHVHKHNHEHHYHD